MGTQAEWLASVAEVAGADVALAFAIMGTGAAPAKPRIRPVGHTPGWWQCEGQGRRAIGSSAAGAYRSWVAASQWTAE